MSIRIFISHKKEDEVRAIWIQAVLLAYREVDTYLDVVDPHLGKNADHLTEYLRSALADCTHLLAVISPQTETSWWVPFEIGLATERAYPIASYALRDVSVPDYLKKWPYLRSEKDLATYVRVALEVSPMIEKKAFARAPRLERKEYASKFHSRLKTDLGQY